MDFNDAYFRVLSRIFNVVHPPSEFRVPVLLFISSELMSQYFEFPCIFCQYFRRHYFRRLISQVRPLWFLSRLPLVRHPACIRYYESIPHCILLVTFRSFSCRLLCVAILSLIFSHFRQEF